MKVHRILVIPGDGIGKEITPAALMVLRAVSSECGIDMDIRIAEAGDDTARKLGEPLPRDVVKLVSSWASAILKGPIGETAKEVVIPLRRIVGAYANLRPVKTLPGVKAMADMDTLIVRENLEDVYVGIEWMVPGSAFAIKVVTEHETRRVARLAAQLSLPRRKRVTIVHKANVLRKTDGLFRLVARHEIRRVSKDIEIDELYVDAAAALLVRKPKRFDVILTMNQYGDILSDLAAELSGGLGLAPSANIGYDKAIFEPVHGAAWDIAGKNIANPTAMIMSTALMLRWLGEEKAANSVEKAIERTLGMGEKTPDIGGTLSTMRFAERVASRIRC